MSDAHTDIKNGSYFNKPVAVIGEKDGPSQIIGELFDMRESLSHILVVVQDKEGRIMTRRSKMTTDKAALLSVVEKNALDRFLDKQVRD